MGSKAEKKVIIVGKYCVGKTALINRFTKNKFDELSPYHPTIGAAFAAKQVTVGRKDVTLGIWDTAGSERFESMTRLYFRGAKAAIVCYDITDKSSFDKAMSYIKELTETNPECRLYLCGTKCDLIVSNENRRDVSYNEAMLYGRNIGAGIVVETSSKTGANVGELFVKIAKDMITETAKGTFEKSTERVGLQFPSQNGSRTSACRCSR